MVSNGDISTQLLDRTLTGAVRDSHMELCLDKVSTAVSL